MGCHKLVAVLVISAVFLNAQFPSVGPGNSSAGASPYDVIFALPGKPPAGEKFFLIAFARSVTMPANFAGSQGWANLNPITNQTYLVFKETFAAETQIGTVVVDTNAGFTFTTTGGLPVTFVPGDTFAIYTPTPQDTQLADVTMTFLGNVTP